LVKRVHYSGKIVNNSQLHFGVFLNGKLEGVMSFGASLDKRKTQKLVTETNWNDFLELNRMAFSEALPRNSESRALSIAFKLIKKHYPHIEWIISFADGTQCGDGTIYRASGFVLTGIKKNTQIWISPENTTFSRMSLTDGRSKKEQKNAKLIVNRVSEQKGKAITENGAASMKSFIDAGFTPLQGFQLRYVYFLNPKAKERLTVPIIPFSKIEEMGAAMYKGEKISRVKKAISSDQLESGGAVPTHTLQNNALKVGDGDDQSNSGGATPTLTLHSKITP
jgi:hypothetical protein